MIKVSVIIPVYGVEAFIERCTRALLGQSLKEVEFIFVDDASPDHSISLLKNVLTDYPERAGLVTILKHPENKGLPAARNTGLAVARGEYIYHCDSDDWMEPELLGKLYAAAIADDADIAYCDFFLSFEKNERYMANPSYKTADEMLRKGFLGGKMKYNVWNKLVRRALYADNDIVFPEGHPMGEDMTIIQLAALAGKVTYVPEALYHYVKLNEGAYSNSYSQKKLEDIRFNVDRTVSFLKDSYRDNLEKEISLFKLSIKLPFLMTDNKTMYRLWEAWYPEANSYANANKDLPARTRFLQIMAAKGQWWYVRLYYLFVFRLIYGAVYK